MKKNNKKNDFYTDYEMKKISEALTFDYFSFKLQKLAEEIKLKNNNRLKIKP